MFCLFVCLFVVFFFGGGALCLVLGQDILLSVPLSAQVYEWLPGNLMLLTPECERYMYLIGT